MFTCKACKKPVSDGQNMVIVTDASVFNDGEVDHGDTEYFHSTCVTIDY